jgi:hypothetical protein
MDSHLPTRAPRRATIIVAVAAALVAVVGSVVWISSVLAIPSTPTPQITSSPANPTNATSATFAFTDSAPGATFECALDSGAFAVCVSPKTYSGPLADGTHVFNVRAQKTNAAVSSPASFTWRVDTAAPSVASIDRTDANPANTGPLHWTVAFNEPVTGVATSNLGLVASGLSGSAPSIVSVAPVGSAPATAWTATVATTGTAAVTGSIGLNLTAKGLIKDAAGNPLGGSVPVTGQAYGYDTTAPTPGSIDRADANPAKSGLLHWTANFNEPVASVVAANFSLATSGLSGSAPSIASVVPVGSAPASSWTITVSTSGATATSGTIGLNLTSKGSIKDAAGNPLGGSVPVAGQAYTYDSTAPAVTLTKVNGATVSFPRSTTANVTAFGGACGTASGDAASVYVSVTGAATQSAVVACTGSGSWSYSTAPTLAAEGTYRVTATQSDAAGNQGSSGERIVVIDRTPPPAPILTNTPASTTDKSHAQFNWYDAEDGVQYRCSLDDAALAGCAPSGVEYKNLADGEHCFTVVAVDAAGNVSDPTTFCWAINSLDFVISGNAVQPLYPGMAPQALNLLITNPNGYAIRVTGITVSVQSETLNGTCATSANFAPVHGLLQPVVVAGHSAISLSSAGIAEADRPQFRMVETHVNQDACRGVTIHLNYAGTAVKA